MKFCSKCKETKNFEFFNKNKAHKDGLQNYCKPCGKTSNVNSYNKNVAQRLETVKKYRATNLDKVKQKNKLWKLNNKEKSNFYLALRNATKLLATPPWFEKEKVAFVYKKAKEWGFDVDHIVPLRGKNVCGLHCWANLQLLDASLNYSKGNREYPNS